MTQKELLYVEDAIGHEQITVKLLQDTEKKLTDAKLKDYIKSEIKEHQNMEKALLKLLEGCCNG